MICNIDPDPEWRGGRRVRMQGEVYIPIVKKDF